MRFIRPRFHLNLTVERLIYIVTFICPLILLSPVIYTGKTLFWGTSILQFIPWRHLAWEMIRNGELPLWNLYVGLGAPLLANYQTALLYPPNWILFAIDTVGGVGWMGWGHAILVALHLAWAGWGMVKLTKSVGIGEVGQAVAGLSFGLSGYLVSRAGFFSVNATVAWLPWILYYCIPKNTREDIGHFSLSQLLKLWLTMSMLLLGGHAQTAWYSLILGLVWVIYINSQRINASLVFKGHCLIKSGRLSKSILSSGVLGLFFYSVAFLGAVALSSIQLLPTIEYLLNSQRSTQVAYEYVSTYSYWPWRLLTLIAPRFFGSPVSGNYGGYGNYWEDALYFGILPLVASVGLIGLIRQKRKNINDHPPYWMEKNLVRFAAIFILVSMVLALGNNTPIFPFLYKYVPTFNMFQAPTRISIWAQFGLALLAGIGVSQWRKPSGKCLYWSRLGIAAGFAVLLGAILAGLFFGSSALTSLQSTALAGFWAMGTGLFFLMTPENYRGNFNNSDATSIGLDKSAIWSLGLIAFVAVDLLIADWGINPGISRELLTAPASTAGVVKQLAGEGRIYLSSEDEYYLKYSRFMRFDTFAPGEDWSNLRSVLLPNTNILDQIASANNFDPIVPSRYEIWMEALDKAKTENRGLTFQRLLNLSGISVVETMNRSWQYGVHFDKVNHSAYLRFVPCVMEVNAPDEALSIMVQGDFDPSRYVIIENAEKDKIIPQCLGTLPSKDNEGSIRVIKKGSNELKLVVENEKSGVLVVSETWYPGWMVEINGKSAQILRANYLFRGIYLEAGINSVVFKYQPKSFFFGCVISGFSLLVFFGLIMVNAHLNRNE